MRKFCILVVLCSLFIVNGAGAIQIAETIGNNSYLTPMNLDSYFSVGPNPEIQGADMNFPWVSVTSSGEAGKHFFSFNALPTTYYFDIDHGAESPGWCDIEMGVWNGDTGQLIARNDDHSPVDPGSISSLDSWIELFFDIPTLVIFGLSEFPSSFGPNGDTIGNLLDFDDRFIVNVSGDFNVAPVPEPGTIFLFGLGIVGLFGVGRKLKSA